MITEKQRASHMQPATNQTQARSSYSPLLVLGHTVNDMYSNLLAGLLPVLIVAFGLSYMLAGLAALVFNAFSSVLQPFLGRWFDRTHATWLLEIGLALNCICMSFVGISQHYVVLLFLLGTAGLGTASFHPPAFSTVVKAGSSRKGQAMGFFIAGGNTGFFLGPIVAGLLLTAYGLHGTLLLLPIGLITALVLLKARVTARTQSSITDVIPTQTPANKRLVGLLASITACRSTTITVAETFLPVYFVARGESLVVATALASVWLGIGILGQFAGGYISDRIGGFPVIASSLLIGTPLFLAFLLTSGLTSIIFLVLAGVVLYTSWTVIVVMASEAAPQNVGTVSGLMLGLAVGIGGFAALGFGALADRIGLQSALITMTTFLFVGGALAFMIPKFSTKIPNAQTKTIA
ncbi:MAG TPA: MFS transporter [Candidatus Acidoferrales bacterium]|nr:MFS transporter [Candidatus Acidoferrales bacterium]